MEQEQKLMYTVLAGEQQHAIGAMLFWFGWSIQI